MVAVDRGPAGLDAAALLGAVDAFMLPAGAAVAAALDDGELDVDAWPTVAGPALCVDDEL